mgnify:CR=1 FL=1
MKAWRRCYKILKRTGTLQIFMSFLLFLCGASFVLVLAEPAINTFGDGLWYCFVAATTIVQLFQKHRDGFLFFDFQIFHVVAYHNSRNHCRHQNSIDAYNHCYKPSNAVMPFVMRPLEVFVPPIIPG